MFNKKLFILKFSWSNENIKKSYNQQQQQPQTFFPQQHQEYLSDQFVPASVSKRAALFEPIFKPDDYSNKPLQPPPPQQQQQQNLSVPNQPIDTSRRNSFNKSNASPSKQVTALPKTQEENEILSSSSSSSYKDNFKRTPSAHKLNYPEQQQQHHQQDVSLSSPSPTNSTSVNEPSKLSMSEKMKLFSNPPSNDLTASKSSKTISKRNSSRFQTQVIIN